MNKIYYSKIFNNIGKTSIIQSPIFISHPECIYIGNNVFIREGLRIEAITQFGDQKFKPFLSIGDNINIEQNVHITCANSLTIGNQTTISSGVLIADNDHCYEQIDKNIMQQQLKIAPTKIGEYCFIGSGAKILAGTILGKQCIVGANAVVRMKNFPDYSVIVGSPARVVKQLNKESMRWEKIETD
jgi:acetyltransferase-like isoleucine patch superfamily enzyme